MDDRPHLFGLTEEDRRALSRGFPQERKATQGVGLTFFWVTIIVAVVVVSWRLAAVEPLPPYVPATPTPEPTATATVVPLMVGFLERCDVPRQGQACVVDFPDCEAPGILKTPGVVCVWRHQGSKGPYQPVR